MTPRSFVASVGALLWAGLVLGPPESRGAQGPPAGVSLTGYWKLDKNRSDDPGDKIKEAMAGLRTVPYMPDPRTQGPYGRRPYPNDPYAQPDPRAAALSVLDDRPTELLIAQRTTMVLIQEGDDEGSVRGVHTDGHRRPMPAGRGEIQGRWESGALVVETWRADGLETVETFELSADPREIKVTLSLTIRGLDPITLTSVYEPDPSKRY